MLFKKNKPRKILLLLFLIFFVLSTKSYGVNFAVDWQTLGFPAQITSQSNYDEVVLNYHVRFSPGGNNNLGVFDPVILHGITGGGTPPISNFADFPAFDLNVALGNGSRNLSIRLNGTTNADFVLAPGQYLFIGGIDTSAVTSIDQFKFSALGGGPVSTTLFDATTTYEVNSTQDSMLTWDKPGSEITFTPSSGTSGVIFLQNNSTDYIDSISFDIQYTVATSLYFGTTTTTLVPEPSTYAIIAGGLITFIFLSKRKKAATRE